MRSIYRDGELFAIFKLKLLSKLDSVTKLITNSADIKSVTRDSQQTVALVPTMGALHRGHLSLVELGQSRAEKTIVSVFVNPTQFNNANDLQNYPRTLEADLELLSELSVDYLYAPSVEQIYHQRFQTEVIPAAKPNAIASVMEGAARPGHFAGMLTIVNILLNIVRPDYAVFGEKDFQQLKLIEQMVADFQIDTEIIRAPLLREPSGLALSSRNQLLSEEGRQKAVAINQSLLKVEAAAANGVTSVVQLVTLLRESLAETPELTIEYVEIADQDSFSAQETTSDNSRIFIVAEIENVRLIDNRLIGSGAVSCLE